MGRSGEILRISKLRVEAANGAILVDDIDLSLKRGEVLGLIGESGAGKSTIALCALAFARAGCRITGGEIPLEGADLTRLDRQGRQRIRGARVAYVAQSAAAAFNPARKLRDQICEAPLRHGLMSREAADACAVALFRALDLPDPERFGDRYPHEVSGGQLQRAMAAMAMSCKPDVLVLDEPTTALDVTTQIEVLALLRRLIRDHGTAGALHHPRPCRGRPDRRPHSRAAPRQDGRGRRNGRDHQGAAPGNTIMRGRWSRSERRRAEPAHQRRTIPATRCSDVDRVSVTHSRYQGAEERLGRSRRARPSRSSANRARASRRSPMPRSDRSAAAGAGILLRRRPLANRLGDRRKRELLRRLQMIYQMPGRGDEPAPDGRHHHRPAARILLRPRAARRSSAPRELLAHVELAGRVLSDRYPAELSGGQKQRVCIARALAAEPEIDHLRRGHLGARSAGRGGHPSSSCVASRTSSASPICSSPTISARCAASPIASS